MFLTHEEICVLTGIHGGNRTLSRLQRQTAALKKMKIPFYVNAGNRIIVVKAVLESGSNQPATPERWKPEVMT